MDYDLAHYRQKVKLRLLSKALVDWLNRRAESPEHGVPSHVLRIATSSALWSYATEPLAKHSVNLDGVTIQDIDFSYEKSSTADLSGVQFHGLSACRAEFFMPSFFGAHFWDLRIEGGQAKSADFSFATFKVAHLLDFDLTDATFENAKLSGVSFRGSILRNVKFDGATLEKVSFDNADLSGATFDGTNWDGTQSQSFSPNEFGEDWSRGPVVRGASFDEAVGLNNVDRLYLCRFGAINVPGGCRDAIVANDADIPSNLQSGSSSCW